MTDINYTPQEIMLRRFYYAHGFFNAYDNVKKLTQSRHASLILKDIAQWIREQRTSTSDGLTTKPSDSSTVAGERVQRARTHNSDLTNNSDRPRTHNPNLPRALGTFAVTVTPKPITNYTIPVRGTYPID